MYRNRIFYKVGEVNKFFDFGLSFLIIPISELEKYKINFYLEHFFESLGEGDVYEKVDGTVNRKKQVAAPDERRDPPWCPCTPALIQGVDL